ncbi:unnamed protein product [Durusdinium trenchii]|uniref:Uncharacterized protein n=1 Tax=Durusdinium trenchii TaxID=1381693 RepID=A0ABP0I752_9DINO
MELRAVIVSGFFLLSCVLCQGGIYLKWFTECCKDFASKPYTLIQEADEGESDVESLAQRLRCEARLMLVLPFLPILAAPYTTCEGGMPFWAYLLCIPFLIRSKWEATLLRRHGWSWSALAMSAEFVLFGPLEQLDFFTDGATPIQAFACEPSATDTYVKAFEASWASMVWVPLVMWLRFGGLLLLALSFAVAVQQGFSTTFGSGDVASVMLSADVAGMLGLATLYEKKSMEEQANVGLSGKVSAERLFRNPLRAAH